MPPNSLLCFCWTSLQAGCAEEQKPLVVTNNQLGDRQVSSDERKDNLMKSSWRLVVLSTLVLTCKGARADDHIEDEEEEGDVQEDLSEFTKDGQAMFKTLFKLRDCAGPAVENDQVTMIM